MMNLQIAALVGAFICSLTMRYAVFPIALKGVLGDNND